MMKTFVFLKLYLLDKKYVFCVFKDDMLRQNIFLAKYAKAAENQARPLGKYSKNNNNTSFFVF
jgi:hypothetical protein